MTGLVVVNADDLGLAAGVNQGIFEAIDAGVVTDVSLMANGAAFDAAVDGLRARGIGTVGLHFCLVDRERPLSGRALTGGLADADGRLPFRNTLFRRILIGGRRAQDAVADELQAQYLRITGAGLRVTHVDSHQHVHLFPGIAEAVLDLCRTKANVLVRVPDPGRLATLMSGPIMALAARMRRRAAARGVLTVRALGFERSGRMTPDVIRQYLAEAESLPCCEIIVHPGRADDHLRSRYRHWNYDWDRELEHLLQSRPLLASIGTRLVTHDGALRTGLTP